MSEMAEIQDVHRKGDYVADRGCILVRALAEKWLVVLVALYVVTSACTRLTNPSAQADVKAIRNFEVEPIDVEYAVWRFAVDEKRVEAVFPNVYRDGYRPTTRFSASRHLDEILEPKYMSLKAEDEVLAEYFKQPAVIRKNDLYLRASFTHFWISEYLWGGEPVKYQCSFLVEIDPAGSSGTRVEVTQVDSRVLVGTKFAMDGSDLALKFMDDIRFVAPTTTDSVRLLDAIEKSLREVKESNANTP